MKQIFLFSLLCLFVARGFSQWNSNTSVNLEVAGLNAGPIATATTSDGKTFVAFYSSVGSNFEMRVQLLNAGGNKLFGADGIIVNSYPTGSATFLYNVCLGPENSFIIACQDQRNGANGAVLIKVMQDGSLPWGNGGVYLGPGLAPFPALLNTGDVIVTWNDNSNKISYQKVTSSGTLAWASSKQIQLTVGSTVYGSTQGYPVPISNGNFIVVMQRRGTGVSGTLYAQRYNSNGDSLWTNYVQLASGTTSTTRYYTALSVADTVYYGYYSSTGLRFNSFVQRVNPDGTLPWGINGAPFSTYSGTQPYNQTTNMAHTPGSPYIWSVCTYSNSAQSQYGIYVQKFDVVTGARLLNVDGKEVYPISASSDQQTGTLALINDAPLLMSYDVNYKIYATLLNGNGDFVWQGNRVELSSTTAGGSTPKGRFNFTPAVNNQTIAVWNENRGTELRAYAQNITAAGATGPLPVTWSGFTAVKNGKQANLSWNTITESNNKGFQVQRSSNGIDFTNLKFVNSQAFNGNSNSTIYYTLTDVAPSNGDNYYRLQQVDKDGKTTYSQTVLVKFNTTGIIVQSLFPNPANKFLHLRYYAAVENKGTIYVLDVKGRLLMQQKVALQMGTASVQLNVAHLPAGNYWLKMTAGGESSTQKWIKN